MALRIDDVFIFTRENSNNLAICRARREYHVDLLGTGARCVLAMGTMKAAVAEIAPKIQEIGIEIYVDLTNVSGSDAELGGVIKPG